MIERVILYRYKGVLHEIPPITDYKVISESYLEEEGVYVHEIKASRPSMLNLLLIIPIIGIIVFNVPIYNMRVHQSFYHITKVPSQMYWDSRVNTIDVDIENDEQNVGSINVKLVNDVDGSTVFELTGINPGESIGAIPIEAAPTNLPVMCTLYYEVLPGYLALKPLEKKVMLVDRNSSDKELNEYF